MLLVAEEDNPFYEYLLIPNLLKVLVLAQLRTCIMYFVISGE